MKFSSTALTEKCFPQSALPERAISNLGFAVFSTSSVMIARSSSARGHRLDFPDRCLTFFRNWDLTIAAIHFYIFYFHSYLALAKCCVFGIAGTISVDFLLIIPIDFDNCSDAAFRADDLFDQIPANFIYFGHRSCFAGPDDLIFPGDRTMKIIRPNLFFAANVKSAFRFDNNHFLSVLTIEINKESSLRCWVALSDPAGNAPCLSLYRTAIVVVIAEQLQVLNAKTEAALPTKVFSPRHAVYMNRSGIAVSDCVDLFRLCGGSNHGLHIVGSRLRCDWGSSTSVLVPKDIEVLGKSCF
jgi:hypothetical protein